MPTPLQGAFTLLFGRQNPRQIRNTVFLIVYSGFRGRSRGMHLLQAYGPGKTRLRRGAALAVAVFFYVISLLILISALPLFVLNIVFQEGWKLKLYPDADNVYGASQWVPLVGLGLTLLAAVFSESATLPPPVRRLS